MRKFDLHVETVDSGVYDIPVDYVEIRLNGQIEYFRGKERGVIGWPWAGLLITPHKLTFDEFLAEANARFGTHEERKGQAYFNALTEVKPELAEYVRGKLDLDPFYQDEKIPMFVAFVTSHWDL